MTQQTQRDMALEFAVRTGGRTLTKVAYSSETIAERVRTLGDEITAAYPEGDTILLLSLLKGSFVFTGDLARAIRRPVHVDFIVASSYKASMESSGVVELLYTPKPSLEGRHVIIVEDIVDSGTTIDHLCQIISGQKPASLEVCALLHKRIAENLQWEPRWVGFNAPEGFLVGYGLDHAEDYRHLPFIAVLDASTGDNEATTEGS